MRSACATISVLVLSAATAGPLRAEQAPPREAVAPPLRLNPGHEYRGVVPGQPNRPPAARRAAHSGVPIVTWPGFQMTANGSRIFLQTSAPVTLEPVHEHGKLVYEIRNSRIELRNNRNPLVTEHFETPVVRAYLRQRGRSVQLVLEMRADVQPAIRQEPAHINGFQYVYLEVAAGHFAPPEPAEILPSAPPPGAPEVPPVAPESIENERPPSFRNSPGM